MLQFFSGSPGLSGIVGAGITGPKKGVSPERVSGPDNVSGIFLAEGVKNSGQEIHPDTAFGLEFAIGKRLRPLPVGQPRKKMTQEQAPRRKKAKNGDCP